MDWGLLMCIFETCMHFALSAHLLLLVLHIQHRGVSRLKNAVALWYTVYFGRNVQQELEVNGHATVLK